LVYGEFFLQGEMEKKLGRQPATIMDRERACIPHLQIQFYDRDVLVIYFFAIFLPLFSSRSQV
ncbi:hypothetical protein DAPPUDRAFT_62223, partial [Daphnia pulex]